MGYSYETADPMTYKLLIEFAKKNRKFCTEAESILWQLLRGNQLGQPFRRQHVIGEFIADFVCLPAMLVIEIDGGYHSLPEQQISDEQRTAWLEKQGYKVIRFSNEEVMCDTTKVLNKIKENIL